MTISIVEQAGQRLIDGSDINTIISTVNGITAGTTAGAYTGTFNGIVGGTTPAAGTFTTLVGTTVNGNTISAGTGILTIAAAKTLTASNSITIAGTDATVMTFPTTTATVARTDAGQTFTGTQVFGAITTTTIAASGAISRSVTNGITAFAGGGQGSATALTADINSITVCATAADSVKLPAATAGRMVQVSNLGAAYANVFPASGEIIDALSANSAISLAVGQSIIFTCSVAGSWKATGQTKQGAKFSTGTTTTTFAAGQLSGAVNVSYASTAGTPGSIATRTATEMFADDPFARVGDAYRVRISNTASAAAGMTITAGSGVTLTGTATVADAAYRDFVVTYTSATALVMQNIGGGTL